MEDSCHSHKEKETCTVHLKSAWMFSWLIWGLWILVTGSTWWPTGAKLWVHQLPPTWHLSNSLSKPISLEVLQKKKKKPHPFLLNPCPPVPNAWYPSIVILNLVNIIYQVQFSGEKGPWDLDRVQIKLGDSLIHYPTLCFIVKTEYWGEFLGSPVIRHPASNARDAGMIPGWGTEIADGSRQLSPCATTREASIPQLRSVWAPESMLHSRKSLHATRENSSSSQLEKTRVLQQRPKAVKEKNLIT